MIKNLDLSSYFYDLPVDLIAQKPLIERSASRLLLRKGDGQISHEFIHNLPKILNKRSLVIVNDSAVIHARFRALAPDGKKIEFLLLEELEKNVWKALAKPRKKVLKTKLLKLSDTTELSCVELEGDSSQRFVKCRFDFKESEKTVADFLVEAGEPPIPPYIRQGEAEPIDAQRYQTVYSSCQGSVAAPTAGLHFDQKLLSELKSQEVEIAKVTLHVGLGTFLPVQSTRISDHQMHEERYIFPSATYESILKAQHDSRDIIVVGTTSLRVLESYYYDFHKQGRSTVVETLDKLQRTSLFIYPGAKGILGNYKPWACSALLTNFHQPNSSLMMLVSALIGLDEIKEAYQLAVRERYRFLSYGDACLFWMPD